ncbi:DEAD/DEAH box helicase family protein [Pseudoroseicyclus aestuarii]|uniref:Type III restriction enzyme n=1 Tax=Pseudoroseicyclus aestuarii TaxID=1795041 RepID=A0A318SMY9_9RHOB|nr:DEAD/DEAH box helicase family protein [Pseudoroseicyclus aestuarii]PYE81323.1 type III restriction enzyme [Pseudoroseicyclus aestuarii]
MKFKFDSDQEYQVDAVESVVGLFDGQAFVRNQLTMPTRATFQVVPNRLDLTPDQLLANLQKVQGNRGLDQDDKLETLAAKVETLRGEEDITFPNFSVEMETGTGKTYVYIRTALRLFETYGLRKFIIVVPSVAVREGVKKTLEVTKTHFDKLFGKPPYHFTVYDSARKSQASGFALSDGIEIMVMTIDAFKRAETVIRQSREGLDPPIYQLQETRPVLILDEPQNMESDLSVSAIASLNPICALRYSATHRNAYNVVYRLTPFDAYRQGLVKRIEVASVVQQDNENLPFVRVEELNATKRTVSAKLSVHKLMATGKIQEKPITVRSGDSLVEKTGRAEYEGFVVDEINPGSGFIRFANSQELAIGGEQGSDRDAIFEAQIAFTIEEHFRRQRRLKEHGIKVLSLFFIDKVDNYAPDDGKLKLMFVKAFDEIKQRYDEWKDVKADDVQKSYFATKTKKTGETEVLDSTGKTKQDDEAFNLIMREKERLLSFEEPVAFIFSHSALREGWDNPNVFQICTMREVGSDTERRQQVGRGVRLPVNQDGDRIRDEQINVLTVIASETYERFVVALQSEIEREYGKEGVPPPPPNQRKRKTIKLRKHFLLKPEFKELWEKIKHKTRYSVQIDTAKLVADTVVELDEATISKPRITVSKANIRVDQAEDFFEPIVLSGAKTAVDLAGRYPLPNLFEVMESMMENTSPPMRLSRRTLLEVFQKTAKRCEATENPHEFAITAVNILKAKLADQMVNGIKYEKDGTWYEQTHFADEIQTWEDYLVPSEEIAGVGGTHLYDGVKWDSPTIEKPFAESLEKMVNVKLYIKLPHWFTIDTPIGRYNPDWAIVMDDPENDEERLYLVRETKGSLDLNDLRPDERRKIICGRKHFGEALSTSYQVVKVAEELPDGGV